MSSRPMQTMPAFLFFKMQKFLGKKNSFLGKFSAMSWIIQGFFFQFSDVAEVAMIHMMI
jgi:hypothetical protein